MIILVLVQAIVGGMFLAKESPLHDQLKDTLGEQVKNDYDATSGKPNGITIAVNILNYMLGCCGINGFTDFTGDKPVMTCCKKETMIATPATCQALASPYNDFNKQGCYSKLQDTISNSLTIAGVVLALLLLMQVVEVVFAILIVKEAGKVGPV